MFKFSLGSTLRSMQDLVSKQQDKKQQLENTQKTIISSGTVDSHLIWTRPLLVLPRKLSFLLQREMGVVEGGGGPAFP